MNNCVDCGESMWLDTVNITCLIGKFDSKPLEEAQKHCCDEYYFHLHGGQK